MRHAYFYERIADVEKGDKVAHVSGALAGEDMEVLGNERVGNEFHFIVQHSSGVHSFRYQDSPSARIFVRSERYFLLGW